MVFPQFFRLIQQIWRKPSREHLFSPRLKRTYRALSFFPLLGLIVALIGINYYAPAFSEIVKLHISSFFSPVIYGLDRLNKTIFDTIPESLNRFTQAFSDAGQLKELKNDRNRLTAQLQDLQQAHTQLQQFLKVPQQVEAPFAVTQAFGHVSDGLHHTLFINSHGLALASDMPVSTPDGIVGKVTTVGEKISRVTTLLDPSFRLPVRVTRLNVQALVAGDGEHGMRLLYLERPEPLEIGDTLVTSGQGGIFPKGLYVGFITALTPEVKIQVAVQPSQVQFVHILKVDTDEIAVTPSPGTTPLEKLP
jgi:rod shape-determining protein MreC